MPPRIKQQGSIDSPQEGLFPIEAIPCDQRGMTPQEISEFAGSIGMAASLRPQEETEPDSTDRWLEERGDPSREYPLAVDPPRPPKKSKKKYVTHYHPSKVVDGDSGLDQYWNVHPEKMTPEEAGEHRAGVAMVRDVLRASRLSDTVVAPDNGAKRAEYTAPKSVQEKLILLINDQRAGFTPTTLGEATLASELIERMHLRSHGEDAIAVHLQRLEARVTAHHKKSGMSLDEAKAEGDSRVLEAVRHMREYSNDSLDAMIALKSLSDARYEVLRGEVPGLFSTSSLSDVMNSNGELGIAFVRLTQGRALRTTRATGVSPIGFDPFRNIGSKAVQIAEKLVTDVGSGKRTNQAEIVAQMKKWLESTTIISVGEMIDQMRRDQGKRKVFWDRALKGVPTRFRPASTVQ